jgi:head-tail adaptor
MAKKQKVSVVNGLLTVEYPTIGKTFKAELVKYSEAIRLAAMEHGFKQKFGDAASGGTPVEKFAEVQAIHASLLANAWERTATIDLTPLICEAVARLKNIPLAKILKAAEKKPEQVKTWSSNAEVKAEIAKIRAEKAAKAAEAAEKEELKVDL